MASSTGASKSICPYFLREYNKSITCEGLCGKDEFMHRFVSTKDKCDYQKKYCFRYDYSRCPLAKILDGKYGQ